MHVSEIVNKNIIRIRQLKRLIKLEKSEAKVIYLREILESIRKHQSELIKIEIRMGGPFKESI